MVIGLGGTHHVSTSSRAWHRHRVHLSLVCFLVNFRNYNFYNMFASQDVTEPVRDVGLQPA
jgi:hypothetical protein